MNRVEGHTHLYDRNDPNGLNADQPNPQTAAHDLNDARTNESGPYSPSYVGEYEDPIGCAFMVLSAAIGTSMAYAVLEKLYQRQSS